MDNQEKLLVNALCLLQSFEKYWMANFLSGGTLYRDVLVEEVSKLDEITKRIPISDTCKEKDSFQNLQVGLNKYFRDQDNKTILLVEDKELIYRTLRDIAILAERTLCDILGIEYVPNYTFSISEYQHPQNLWEWLGQVHPAMINLMDGAFADSMSQSDTIAIVADIRRSQDLMTYSSPDIYSSKIIEFTGAVKDIILTNNGIFDKFTGDGFIAYFNKCMCEEVGDDYYNQMWMACVRIMEYANQFFAEWCKHLRKVPEEKIGLSIGIDSGKILFTILDHQVFAVGEPCVWATRMSSAGHSGDVIFNNIPYNHILDCHLGLNFHEVESTTKTGEKFKCHKVII